MSSSVPKPIALPATPSRYSQMGTGGQSLLGESAKSSPSSSFKKLIRRVSNVSRFIAGMTATDDRPTLLRHRTSSFHTSDEAAPLAHSVMPFGDTVTCLSVDDHLGNGIFCAGGVNRQVVVYDLATCKQLRAFPTHASVTCAQLVHLPPRKRVLLIGMFDGRIEAYDVDTGVKESSQIFCEGEEVHSMSVSRRTPRGAAALQTALDSSSVLDRVGAAANTAGPHKRVTRRHASEAGMQDAAAAYARRSSELMAVGGKGVTVCIYAVSLEHSGGNGGGGGGGSEPMTTMTVRIELQQSVRLPASVRCVALSGDGNVLAVGGEGQAHRRLTLFDLREMPSRRRTPVPSVVVDTVESTGAPVAHSAPAACRQPAFDSHGAAGLGGADTRKPRRVPHPSRVNSSQDDDAQSTQRRRVSFDPVQSTESLESGYGLFDHSASSSVAVRRGSSVNDSAGVARADDVRWAAALRHQSSCGSCGSAASGSSCVLADCAEEDAAHGWPRPHQHVSLPAKLPVECCALTRDGSQVWRP